MSLFGNMTLLFLFSNYNFLNLIKPFSFSNLIHSNIKQKEYVKYTSNVFLKNKKEKKINY